MNLLSTLPKESHLVRERVRGAAYIDILMKLMTSDNSLIIFKDYRLIFNSFMSIFDSSRGDGIKFELFKSIIKFCCKNNWAELKQLGIFDDIVKKVEKYLYELRSEKDIVKSLNEIKEKFLKTQNLHIQFLKITQFLLENKNTGILKNIVLFNFSIIKNTVFLQSSINDLITTHKKKQISDFAFLFENLIEMYEKTKDPKFRNIFDNEIFTIFYGNIDSNKNLDNLDINISGEKEDSGKISNYVFLLLLLTKGNNSSNMFLHMYFLECLGYNKTITEYIQHVQNLSKANPEHEQEPNLDGGEVGNEIILTDSVIDFNFESLKKGTLNDKDIINSIGKIYNSREKYSVRRNAASFILRIEKFFDNELEKSNFKKSLLLNIDNEDILSIINLGEELIEDYNEEDDEDQKESIKFFLHSAHSVFLYYIKINLNNINIYDANTEASKIKELPEDEEDEALKVKELNQDDDIVSFHGEGRNKNKKEDLKKNYDSISYYIEGTIIKIIDFIQLILTKSLIDKNILDFMIIMFNSIIEFKLPKVNLMAWEIIREQFVKIAMEGQTLSIKSLGKLIADTSKLSNEKTLEPFPDIFFTNFFNENNCLLPLRLLTEILRFIPSLQLKEIIFGGKYKSHVLEEIRKMCFDNLKTNYESLEKKADESISESLYEIIRYYIEVQHESLKYELYLILFENPSEFNEFQKKTFVRIYNLLEDEEDNQVKDKFKIASFNVINNISLLFLTFKYEKSVKITRQIKLSNLVLSKDEQIRNFLIGLIEKILPKYFNFHY